MSEHNTRGLPSEHIVYLPLHILTDTQRIRVHFHYVEGWTLQRIAEAWPCSHQAVSGSITAAKRRIVKQMTADGSFPDLQNDT